MRAMPFIAALAACTPGAGDPDPAGVSTYAFVGRDGRDSVAYVGQTFRHLLIADLGIHLGRLGDRLEAGFAPEEGEVAAELDFYLSFDGETSGEVAFLYATDPPPLQETYADVATGKDLVGKIAGNDPVGQHRDWSTDFVGWSLPDGPTTPERLVRHWFDAIDAQAVAWAAGEAPVTASGVPVPAPTVTPAGQDLAELTVTFLLGAVAVSQAADDYLDDDLEGKGLRSDHTALVDGEPYTTLEHAWDEGFGYFGAARGYGGWTGAEIVEGARDDDGDGAIDLLTEVSFGHAREAAARDLDAVGPTAFATEAWAGFVAGRRLIAEASGPLTGAELARLQEHRDRALAAWEAAIAATALHHLNRTLGELAAMDTDAYDLAAHARHWSALKGHALAFQFMPRSALSDDDFAVLHDWIGQAPVLADADVSVRRARADDLRAARALLGDAFGFDPATLGDDDGANGW